MQQPIGFGLRPLGEPKGVIGDGAAQAENGDGRGDIELVQKGRIHRQDADRKQEPRRDVQHEENDDGCGAERQVLHAQNEKACRGADDQVQLNAGVAAEQGHQRE